MDKGDLFFAAAVCVSLVWEISAEKPTFHDSCLDRQVRTWLIGVTVYNIIILS